MSVASNTAAPQNSGGICDCNNNLKEAEIRQPWVINGHNTHTPDSREACQAIAFYDNFTPEKSRPIKIEALSVA